MSSPLLTIVIPTRNRLDLFELSLRSVYEAQERIPPVIVSDNSTADQEEMTALRSRYPFTYVRQSGTLSMVDHHNACLELVSTPWALLLHDDDELSPNVLTRLEALLPQSGDAGLILGGTEFIDENGASRGTWIPEATLNIKGESAVLRLGLEFTAYPPSCVWNMAAFRRCGGFPDANGAGADYTLMLQLANQYGVVLFAEILGRYRIGPQQSTGYSSPERAEATLDCSITMAQLTRNIGVPPAVSDQLLDYMIWWIFRIVAQNLLDSHPFFVWRMYRKCASITPRAGRWRSRIRSEYPFLFWRPQWLWELLYCTAKQYLPRSLRRKLSGGVRTAIG
jgi:glycosyltransferase involved in cell wall biosynthesis